QTAVLISSGSFRHEKRWFTIVPLPGSHLTRYTSGPFCLRCSPPRLLPAAAEGGLESSPVRRLRGAYPHRLHSCAKRVVCRRLVLLVAHLERELHCKLQLPRVEHGTRYAEIRIRSRR